MVSYSTKIRIYDEKEALKKLFDEIAYSLKFSKQSFNDHKNYIGTFTIGPQLGVSKGCDFVITQCVMCKDGNKDYLDIKAVSNWCSYIDAWKAFVYKMLPNATMFYYCFGDGDPLLYSNDPKVKDKYSVSASKNKYNIKNRKYATQKQVKNILQQILKTTEEDVSKLLMMYNTTEIDDLDLIIVEWHYFPDFYSERGVDNRA